MLNSLGGNVNFLKGANQESEWHDFYNQENAAFDALDKSHNGISVDVDDSKRFKAIINLKNVPIDTCLNSKIQSEHTFNMDTEQSRLPTNNPEYNAALYDWQKYTGDQQIGAYLNNPDN